MVIAPVPVARATGVAASLIAVVRAPVVAATPVGVAARTIPVVSAVVVDATATGVAASLILVVNAPDAVVTPVGVAVSWIAVVRAPVVAATPAGAAASVMLVVKPAVAVAVAVTEDARTAAGPIVCADTGAVDNGEKPSIYVPLRSSCSARTSPDTALTIACAAKRSAVSASISGLGTWTTSELRSSCVTTFSTVAGRGSIAGIT